MEISGFFSFSFYIWQINKLASIWKIKKKKKRRIVKYLIDTEGAAMENKNVAEIIRGSFCIVWKFLRNWFI